MSSESSAGGRMTFSEFAAAMWRHNSPFDGKGQDPSPLRGVIVFSPSNWPGRDYSLESRSYAVSSDNKAWIHGIAGHSIYGDSLDGTDLGVRLDLYMRDGRGGPGGWTVDYCYLLEGSE